MKTQLSRWLPLVLILALIFILSANQDPYRLLPFETPFEKWLSIIGHFVEYTLLGFAALRAIQWQDPPLKKRNIAIFVFCLLYALSDEFHQTFVPGRLFQIQDLLIDSAGIFTGILIYQKFQKNRLEQSK